MVKDVAAVQARPQGGGARWSRPDRSREQGWVRGLDPLAAIQQAFVSPEADGARLHCSSGVQRLQPGRSAAGLRAPQVEADHAAGPRRGQGHDPVPVGRRGRLPRGVHPRGPGEEPLRRHSRRFRRGPRRLSQQEHARPPPEAGPDGPRRVSAQAGRGARALRTSATRAPRPALRARATPRRLRHDRQARLSVAPLHTAPLYTAG